MNRYIITDEPESKEAYKNNGLGPINNNTFDSRFKGSGLVKSNICLQYQAKSLCSKGEDCKNSHDLQAAYEKRPGDIVNPYPELLMVEDDNEEKKNESKVESNLPLSCPLFELNGFCKFGVSCRLGSSHITSDGTNVFEEENKGDSVSNYLPFDVMKKLNRKKYPFVTRDPRKRKRKGKEEEQEEEKKVEESEYYGFGREELKPLKVVDFSNKIYICPLTTIGNIPFRRIMKQFLKEIICHLVVILIVKVWG